jgi:hypothetical protein
MRRPLLAALLAAGLVLPARLPYAYETPAHARFAAEAARASSVPARLPDIGANMKLFTLDSLLSDGGLYLFGLTLFQLERPVSGWFSEGAVREDDFCCSPPLRFTNHFYNPIAPAGSRGYLGITTDSLQWGLEPTDMVTQSYSFRDAREYLYQAFTATGERERKRNMSLVFRSLGQVSHLLQDAAQPQHTRNDSHATGSLYEQYTTRVLGNLSFSGYGSVAVTSPDQLWTTPDFKGIADYSNRGFVTAGTNLVGRMTGNTLDLRPNPNFPQPNGTGATIQMRQITDSDLLGPVGPGQPLQGEMWFVSTPVVDSYDSSQSGTNARTTTFSIFDDALANNGFDWTFSYNRFNFDAAHPFLIPRAVGYSAGLFDYFFRGQLEITAPDDVVYGMIDPTQTSSFTQVKFKARNTHATESMSGGTLWAVAKFHRNTCYQADLTGEANGPNAPDIVACRSTEEEVAVSAPKGSITLAAGAAPSPLSFDFSAAPIPVNATDLFLQLVYRGPMGSEADAVAVGTLDLYEPTHIAFMNGFDVTEISDKFYLFDDVLAGIAAGDPTFATIDLNQDRKFTVPPDANVTPFDLSNVDISFTGPSLNPIANIPSLPAGRFARITVLTDRPSLDFYPGGTHFHPPSAVNQVSDDGTTFFVTSTSLLRKIQVTDGDVLNFCIFSTSCNGDLSTMPASNNPDAATPEPVTVNQQFP